MLDWKEYQINNYEKKQLVNAAGTQQQHVRKQGMFALIEDFNIHLHVQLVKAGFMGNKEFENDADFFVRGELPSMRLRLNPYIYKRVLKIGQCFSSAEEEAH